MPEGIKYISLLAEKDGNNNETGETKQATMEKLLIKFNQPFENFIKWFLGQ